MSKIEPHQIAALGYLANAIRPAWDRAGIEAKLREVDHLPLADVALALIRAADDPAIATPGAFAKTTSSCWRERNHDRPVAREPFDPASTCGICGKPESRCRAVAPHIAGHAFASLNQTRAQQRRREDIA